MQKLSICVLGSQDNYTRMVVHSLQRHGLDFTLVLEGGGNASSRVEQFLATPLRIYRALTTGRFKALPKLSFFTARAFIRERLFLRSAIASDILRPFQVFELKGVKVPSVNHVRVLRLIERERFDMGIFAGVGIVDGAIIDAFGTFCLNAHPAPLPQCRGGGALINTLDYGLHPAVSVHIATAEIDEGRILRVRPLELRKSDSYESINLRLSVLGAETLVEVASEIAQGTTVSGVENSGKLHYWKDCTIDRQRRAEKQLQMLLRDL